MKNRLEMWVWESGRQIDPATGVTVRMRHNLTYFHETSILHKVKCKTISLDEQPQKNDWDVSSWHDHVSLHEFM